MVFLQERTVLLHLQNRAAVTEAVRHREVVAAVASEVVAAAVEAAEYLQVVQEVPQEVQEVQAAHQVEEDDKERNISEH